MLEDGLSFSFQLKRDDFMLRLNLKTMRNKVIVGLGAAVGGVVGALLGAEFGLVGAALGGALAYGMQEIAESAVYSVHKVHTRLAPRIVGSIPTDISLFTGREELLDTLSKFLRSKNGGVCTLLGLGGCGKSALLKKFAHEEALFSSPSRKSAHDALFSWSFSQDDSLEHFFDEFQKYIIPLFTSAQVSNGSSTTLNPLVLPDLIKESGKRIILFLDGLERVIDERYTENTREGSVSTPALKALLQRAAQNDCGMLRIFITTRIPIPEIGGLNSGFSITLDLNQMEERDAVALLEKSGARGEYEQLAEAVHEYRLHAYSITLLGRALAEVYRGDVRRRDRLMIGGYEDESPIGRILVWYLHHLDDYSICFLKSISIYRSSVVDSEIYPLLSSVAEKENYAELVWAMDRVVRVRSRLSRIGLIFVSEEPSFSGERIIDLHPIVRDFFYNLLMKPADLHERILEILSAEAPERALADVQSTTVLVEMIYHAVRSHHYELAWNIYLERLGGYENLGYNRAEHPLGSRIIYTFLDDPSFAHTEIPEGIRTNLYMDGALYLKNEGRLDDAIDMLNSVSPNIEVNIDWPDQFASLLLVKSGIELMRGRIPEAKKSIRRANIEFEKIKEYLDVKDVHQVEKECLSRLATSFAISAEPTTAELFEKAARIPDHPDTIPHDHLPIGYGWFLMLRGDYNRARDVLQEGLVIPMNLDLKMLTYRVKSMMVLNEAAAGNTQAAEGILHEITAWTLKPDLHIFVLTWLMRAKIALAKQDYDETRAIVLRGLEYAGNNGYVLEWIDLVLTLATAAFYAGDYDEANRFAQLALNGDNTSYSYPIPGASAKSVNYVWASLPAEYIRIYSAQIETGPRGNTIADAKIATVINSMSELRHPFLSQIAEHTPS